MKPRSIFAVAIAVAALFLPARAWAFNLNDVIKQTQAGIADSLIVRQIQQSGRGFRLSSEDFRKLKQAGVSDEVMSALVMSDRPKQGPPLPSGPSTVVHVVAQYGPYPYPYPYYYPPGFSFGVSFGFGYPYRVYRPYPYHLHRW